MKAKRMLAAGMAITMAASVILSGCSSKKAEETPVTSADSNTTIESKADGDNTAKGESDIEKPKKITIMCNGTVYTKANARDEFQKKWEELTGIELEIIQPDHDAYWDVVGQTFASGPENWPDVLLMGSTFYTGYAKEGALWDMTDAWENSELKASGRVNAPEIFDSLKIDGRLYGFPVNRGNGCITYVKKAWLDNLGLDVPTTYEEYLNMLKQFTEGDPDGNGVDGDTYGVSAAGIVGSESPYINYLPEFYQDAYPSFTKDENGQWYDGFTKDNFKDALTRLKEAYAAGYMDKETLTNGTKDCRNKFYEDKFGVFTYWAGTWASTLKNNLEKNGHSGELIPLKPLKEVGTYIERTAGTWSITASCENPEGVFKYFLEPMLDGGEMETLWSFGVEDVHWSTKAETVLDNTYKEGEFHFEESLEVPGTQYTKGHIDQMLNIVNWDSNPGEDAVAPEAKESQLTFNENCRQDLLVPSTEEMATYNGDLITLKRNIIADVVVQGLSIDEAYQRFQDEGGAEWSQMIVDSLNAQETAQ